MTASGRSIFRESFTEWRCPACWRVVESGYKLDEGGTRCKRNWHITEPIGRRYVLAPDEPRRAPRPEGVTD